MDERVEREEAADHAGRKGKVPHVGHKSRVEATGRASRHLEADVGADDAGARVPGRGDRSGRGRIRHRRRDRRPIVRTCRGALDRAASSPAHRGTGRRTFPRPGHTRSAGRPMPRFHPVDRCQRRSSTFAAVETRWFARRDAERHHHVASRVSGGGPHETMVVVDGRPGGGACREPGAGPDGIGAAPVEPLRLNHFQVKGSHNSFHIEHAPEVIDSYMTVNPTAYRLAFTHPPLADQLDLGFRQFEFDVFTDPAGDRFPPIGTPGFKALHIEAIDEGSQCPLFTDCLRDLEAWSDAHPRAHAHCGADRAQGRILHTHGPRHACRPRGLDAEIRSVLDADQLVTPDFVKGVGRAGGADGHGTVYPDVESAILAAGWPLLEDTRQPVHLPAQQRARRLRER